MTYRKIGGIHWFSFGRWRISVCRVKKPKAEPGFIGELLDRHPASLFTKL